MKQEQLNAILYAYLDLKGVVEAIDYGMTSDIDLEVLKTTIKDLENNFDFIQKDKEQNLAD